MLVRMKGFGGFGGSADTGNTSGIDCTASWVSAVSMATGRLG